MALIIQKFGGTSVGNIPKIKAIANIVQQELNQGNKVVVVVSAMAGVTNQLITFCNDVSSLNSDDKMAEYDTVLCSGEIVTTALTALSLQEEGINARSILAWQAPIRTTSDYSKALVHDIDTKLLEQCLQHNIVPVVAGFQGVNNNDRCTTLGRGGSDTTASLIAAALQANRCDIYSDVDGVFTADPRIVNNAQKISILNFEEMLELASSGAKVLNSRCVEIAMRYNIPIRVLSTFDYIPLSLYSGTLITSKDNIMETTIVKAVTSNKNLLKVNIKDIALDVEQVCKLILGQGIAIEVMFNLNGVYSLIIPLGDQIKLEALLSKLNLKFDIDTQIATVSLIGYGIKNDTMLLASILSKLQQSEIPIIMMQNFEIRLSLLLEDKHTEKAIRIVHDLIVDSSYT